MKTISLDVNHPVDEARFWIWVEKGDSCWEWQGVVNSNGYGRWSVGGKQFGAHRASWEIANGPIPDGAVIDHKCHNKICVNPDHLHPVTHKANIENYLPVRASSGYRGVHKKGSKWGAYVRHNRKLHYGGLFDSPEEANEAAIALRAKLFTNSLTDRAA